MGIRAASLSVVQNTSGESESSWGTFGESESDQENLSGVRVSPLEDRFGEPQSDRVRLRKLSARSQSQRVRMRMNSASLSPSKSDKGCLS